MFDSQELKDKLKAAENKFYGSDNLNFFQKNGRLNKMCYKNKKARKVPKAQLTKHGMTGLSTYC